MHANTSRHRSQRRKTHRLARFLAPPMPKALAGRDLSEVMRWWSQAKECKAGGDGKEDAAA